MDRKNNKRYVDTVDGFKANVQDPSSFARDRTKQLGMCYTAADVKHKVNDNDISEQSI